MVNRDADAIGVYRVHCIHEGATEAEVVTTPPEKEEEEVVTIQPSEPEEEEEEEEAVEPDSLCVQKACRENGRKDRDCCGWNVAISCSSSYTKSFREVSNGCLWNTGTCCTKN